MGKEMWGRDCGERDAVRGLWEKRCGVGTVGKGMQ